ncbi:MAG: chorismate synthase [Planctomycetaceae bacterium]|nr:chorismate synthase [Planctomycetaceae bacterium]
MIRYWTAGESHGKGHIAFLDSFPAGLFVDKSYIDSELRRRQGGYGRGERQKIEADEVEILTGIWHDKTIGSPVVLWVKNRDAKINDMSDLTAPRPGHGDLAGMVKYHSGIRPILERASARGTTSVVAAGALAKLLLLQFDIHVTAYVVDIGGLTLELEDGAVSPWEVIEMIELRNKSEFYSLRPDLDAEAKRLVDQCRDNGGTLGGLIDIRVDGVPFGLGTHAQWDLKLDGRLAQAVMAVQAIKGVEIGLGFQSARQLGQNVHDPIVFNASQFNTRSFGFSRTSNHAGGIEAGMTNSEPILIRAALKPIATLKAALPSVDFNTMQPSQASYERSDVCAVPAAGVVLEAIVALEVAKALTEKFGSDNVEEMKAFYQAFCEMARQRFNKTGNNPLTKI